MRARDAVGPRRGLAVWAVLPRALELGALVVLLLAVGTELVTAASAGASLVQFLPVALVVTSIVVAVRLPSLGLALAAAAPLLAVLVGRVPSTGIWSMACFVVFLLTLRGASALASGALVAVANFAAVAWEVGTVSLTIDSSASIAAFSAVVCAAIGSAVHGNHRYRVEAEQRVKDAEATRQAAVERGVAQERLRIARDLHDSVGHQIAVVNMRLGAAEVHLPSGAEQTRTDLAQARDGVQAVLRETQQILAVLRVGDGERALEPTPGHGAIEELVDSYRQAGMALETSIDTFARAPSAQASAAIYRIVQESLTNAQKHGYGTVSLTVRQDEDGDVLIEVANLRLLRGAPFAGGGNGLVGMRERAESLGGELTARADDGLFWVTATIPATGEDGR